MTTNASQKQADETHTLESPQPQVLPDHLLDVNMQTQTITLRSPKLSSMFPDHHHAANEVSMILLRKRSVLHLGLIAIVACESNGNERFTPIQYSQMSDEVWACNYKPYRNSQKQISDVPSAALLKYFNQGIPVTSKMVVRFIVNKKTVSSNILGKDILRLFKCLITTSGTPSDDTQFDTTTFCLNPEITKRLDITPKAITKESLESIKDFIAEMKKAAGKTKQVSVSPANSLTEVLDTLGIVGASPEGVSEARLHFKEASSIKLLAYACDSLTKASFREIGHALAHGATVQVILGDPNNRFWDDSQAMTHIPAPDRKDQRYGHIRDAKMNLEKSLKEANRLVNREGTKGPFKEIEVRYFKNELRCFLTICDDKWGWFTPHLPPKESLQTPSFELNRRERGLLEDCVAYFDVLWERLKGGKSEKLSYPGAG